MLNILTMAFLKIYEEIKNEKLLIEDYDLLESTLQNFLINVLGYKTNYLDYMKEVEVYFENIIVNMDKYKTNIINSINQYLKDYLSLLEKHPLTTNLIESINKLSSSSFNIKDVEQNKTNETNIAIKHKENTLEVTRKIRLDEEEFPTIVIKNIDSLEQTLKEYILSIKLSTTFYNIFEREAFQKMDDKEKIQMIFEGACLNLSYYFAKDIETFFKMYTDFINDETLKQFNYPIYLKALFGDELYIMTKRSELWYETPYYLSFMLKNRRIEFPNVRIGINNENDKKVAHIIATQTCQVMNTNEEYQKIEAELKQFVPKDNHFRFHNPTHLISLILTCGLLKGLGIEQVKVVDYMPFRYKKIINDKQLNEEEANIYQTRLTTKNIMTYMNLINTMEGIIITNYPQDGSELTLQITDNVNGKNEFFSYLFKIGYEFGIKYKKSEKKYK